MGLRISQNSGFRKKSSVSPPLMILGFIELWKVLNEIINRRKTKCKISKLKIGENEITNSADICNHFNSYFCNIACNIASKLKSEIQHSSADKEDTDAMKYLQVCQCEQSCACTKYSIFLEPCSITEITTIIKELNNYATSD